LAEELELQDATDEIRVFLPRQNEAGKKVAPSFQVFRVAGTFTSGLREFDRGFALVESQQLQKIYGLSGVATGLEFRLREPDQAEWLAGDIKKSLGPGYDAVAWQQLNGPLFQALRLERTVFFIIMSMVVTVAAFNIVGVLILMIFDKGREISILRAMGAPHRV
jgi:lipoprotein-releasing system permease protein